MYSRAVHWLAGLDTDTCSGWERRRCEWLCAASSSRQERPCLARSTSQARSPRSPAAAARLPARGSARARSSPCATATPAVSTHASWHRHQRCQSAAPPPLCTKLRSSSRELICRQSYKRWASQPPNLRSCLLRHLGFLTWPPAVPTRSGCHPNSFRLLRRSTSAPHPIPWAHFFHIPSSPRHPLHTSTTTTN